RTIDGCLGLFDHGEYVFFTARLYELGVRAHAELSLLARDDAVRDSHLKQARGLLDRLDQVIAELVGHPQPRTVANRAACVAELSRIAGSEPAAGHEAERLSQAIGDAYQVAYTRWRRAEALIHNNGDPELVQDLVRQAFRTADKLGARPLCDGVET